MTSSTQPNSSPLVEEKRKVPILATIQSILGIPILMALPTLLAGLIVYQDESGDTITLFELN